MTGEIQLQDLVVTKTLGQDLNKYRSLFSHVSAAIQLAREGKSAAVGEGVEYIFTNAGHTNPLCRVIPLALIEKDIDYDKEKYREMPLEAAETVLGYFGFDRSMYEDANVGLGERVIINCFLMISRKRPNYPIKRASIDEFSTSNSECFRLLKSTCMSNVFTCSKVCWT